MPADGLETQDVVPPRRGCWVAHIFRRGDWFLGKAHTLPPPARDSREAAQGRASDSNPRIFRFICMLAPDWFLGKAHTLAPLRRELAGGSSRSSQRFQPENFSVYLHARARLVFGQSTHARPPLRRELAGGSSRSSQRFQPENFSVYLHARAHLSFLL